MPRKSKPSRSAGPRRCLTEEFKEEAVQMLRDGHAATSVAERLGLSRTNTLYRWKQQYLQQAGPVAGSLEARVKELELRRVERERDFLNKGRGIGIFDFERKWRAHRYRRGWFPASARRDEHFLFSEALCRSMP